MNIYVRIVGSAGSAGQKPGFPVGAAIFFRHIRGCLMVIGDNNMFRGPPPFLFFDDAVPCMGASILDAMHTRHIVRKGRAADTARVDDALARWQADHMGQMVMTAEKE